MLESINGLTDLKKLDIKQLPALCEDIRNVIIQTVTKNGGHLASNLGVVELTVALHYVFDVDDKIIWDVGHQSYIHKLLTGRKDDFDTLRQKDGISGFPDCQESSLDAFNTGHASTSISAGLGIAKARDILKQDFNVVAVIGDGALTGGESYEGLNSIGNTKMLVVLNDNNMAIDKNVGSATRNLSKVRVRKGYLKFKSGTKKFLNAIPLIGKPLLKLCKNIIRNVRLSKLHNIYFENFKIKYIGPVNGHDIKDLVFYLTKIKNNVTVPTCLHVLTQKGHGFDLAENDPQKYHGVSSQNSNTCDTMSQIVGDTLCKMAQNDSKIVAISAAMTYGTGLAGFSKQYADRFFDVGIAEQHAVTFAAGLAKQGLKPYVAIYSTFLQRAYDQILHDVCIQNLPVTFCIDRAGFVGQDGQTHQGLFDLCYLSSMPNLTILAPADKNELNQMLLWSRSQNTPIAIRYPRSATEIQSFNADFNLSKWQVVSKCTKTPIAAILAVGGNALTSALQAKQILAQQNKQIDVYNASSIKPLDKEVLFDVLNKCKVVLTAEEGMLVGGFASLTNSFASSCNSNSKQAKVINVGVEDKFVKHATIEQQLEDNGISAQNFVDVICKALSK